jgi:protein-L-isoaspartate(D-aspartate) O-methyltransferase
MMTSSRRSTSIENLNNGLPSAVARSLDAMNIQPGEHVVHAGCGTGYYTALIAHLVTESGGVTAIELDTHLAGRARTNLRPFRQVEVVAGDATRHDPGPVDAIFGNAGATHPCPSWLHSMKPSGRLVLPMIRWPEGIAMGVGKALEKNGLTDVRSLRAEGHDPEESCLLHGKRYCFSRLDCS